MLHPNNVIAVSNLLSVKLVSGRCVLIILGSELLEKYVVLIHLTTLCINKDGMSLSIVSHIGVVLAVHLSDGERNVSSAKVGE